MDTAKIRSKLVKIAWKALIKMLTPKFKLLGRPLLSNKSSFASFSAVSQNVLHKHLFTSGGQCGDANT
jgi:hypothetical protein